MKQLSIAMLFASLFFFILSCNTSQKASTKITKAPTKEMLLEMPSIERLIAMQTGKFLMYDSAAITVRAYGTDSLILFSCPVGDPNKDGHWMYQKMYMSSLPDEPLSTDFLKFSKISRDSFAVEQFKADKQYAMADKQVALLKEIDFKELESVACPIAFEKLNQLKFEGTTPVCTIDFDGGKSQIYANFFRVTPAGFFLRSSYYKKIGEEVQYASKGTCYFKRF